jgi:hypothetical protein
MRTRRSRPMLNPTLRVLWRDAETAQLGTDPARARILAGLPNAAGSFLELLDGTRTDVDLVAAGSAVGLDPDEVDDLLSALRGADALLDGDPRADLPARLTPAEHRRLESELSAVCLTGAATPGAVLAARAERQVVVRGGGRVAVLIATIFAASGIGRVHVAASGVVTEADVGPGAHRMSDVLRPRATSAVDAVRASSADVDTRPPRTGTRPDLVVLSGPAARAAVVEAMTPEFREVPHLVVGLRDGIAVIGPLIVPGETACLYCVHLHRIDRDPGWPVIEAQLGTAHPDQADGCAAGLTVAAAGLAAMQALCHLDGGRAETLSASLELRDPGAAVRRRSWPIHPRCGCRTGHAQTG